MTAYVLIKKLLKIIAIGSNAPKEDELQVKSLAFDVIKNLVETYEYKRLLPKKLNK